MVTKLSEEVFSSLSSQVQEYILDLEHDVTHDQLTKVLTRSAFTEIASHELLSLKREKDGSTLLLFFDVNDFKSINDKYGHLAGDEVLKEIVKRFKFLLRETDIIARYAGDEFIGLLDISNNKEAVNNILNKMMISTEIPLIFESKIIPFGISLGAVILNKETTSLNDAIKKADEAMYEAKKGKASGSKYVVF